MPESSEAREWVLYDGSCDVCIGLARRSQRILARRGFGLRALQDPWAMERLGLAPGEVPEEIKLVTAPGPVLGGVEALLHLARSVWWARPFAALAGLPGGRAALEAGYRAFARRRHCMNGACSAPARPEQEHIDRVSK